MMKPLNFSHITKTGGSTIANVSNRSGLKWAQYNKKQLQNNRNDIHDIRGPVWHQPLSYFTRSFRHSFDWFCVMRDPIERCVSEFHCKWSGWKHFNPHGTPTAANLNAFISRSIKTSLKFAHWHPQSRYIFDPSGRRLVKHVLKFDNFIDEFNELAAEYKIDARILPEDWANRRTNNKLTSKDLTKETRDLILKRYELDQLIYERLSP